MLLITEKGSSPLLIQVMYKLFFGVTILGSLFLNRVFPMKGLIAAEIGYLFLEEVQ